MIKKENRQLLRLQGAVALVGIPRLSQEQVQTEEIQQLHTAIHHGDITDLGMQIVVPVGVVRPEGSDHAHDLCHTTS